jgi:mannose-1-phosphate guanylyltransferase
MKTNNFYAVILAGGKGERFWPLSTSRHPKQVLSLIGDKPLIGLAVERIRNLIPPENVYIITSNDLVDVICQAVPELPAANVIGEPMGRDTAAAIALGSALIEARDPEGVFCVLTADHIIGDLPVFEATIHEGLSLAGREEVLLTIGIQPASPSTGYGYIEAAEEFKKQHDIQFLKAKKFVEKPNLETAQKYVESGRYFWNSGMFMWSVKSFRKAMEKYRPPLADMMRRLLPQIGTKAFATALSQEYGQLEKISIDYALMEKADNIVMARGTFAWDDVGSWTALENHLPKDGVGNTIQGSCEMLEAGENIVFSPNRLTALIGVKNLVVVQAEGVTLVCPRERAQDIKKLVDQLRKSGRYDKVL